MAKQYIIAVAAGLTLAGVIMFLQYIVNTNILPHL